METLKLYCDNDNYLEIENSIKIELENEIVLIGKLKEFTCFKITIELDTEPQCQIVSVMIGYIKSFEKYKL